MKVLIIGGLHYGFRIYGPFSDEKMDDDPAFLEDKHKTERDHHEGTCFWAELMPPLEGK